MECKACGKKLKIDHKTREQGWVECSECHAIFSIQREDGAAPQAAAPGPASPEATWQAPERTRAPVAPSTSAPNPETGNLRTQPAPQGQDLSEFIPPTLAELKTRVKQAGGIQAFAERMQEQLLQRVSKGNTPPSGPRRQVELPKGMHADHGDKLVITRTWFSPATIFFLLFAVIWDVVLAVFVLGFLGGDDSEPLFFMSFHFLAGAFITYKVICDFINRTTITASKDLLELKHGPLWWPGNKQLETRGIKQIYVRKHVSTSSKGSSTVTYSVDAKKSDDTSTTILGGLSNADQALYIEQSVESYLGITDEWVDGSYT